MGIRKKKEIEMQTIKIDNVVWEIQDIKGNIYTLKNDKYIISKLMDGIKC